MLCGLYHSREGEVRGKLECRSGTSQAGRTHTRLLTRIRNDQLLLDAGYRPGPAKVGLEHDEIYYWLPKDWSRQDERLVFLLILSALNATMTCSNCFYSSGSKSVVLVDTTDVLSGLASGTLISSSTIARRGLKKKDMRANSLPQSHQPALGRLVVAHFPSHFHY
jgi:hypothetical protein